LESIQAENDILLAKHSKHAVELQEELINLPSTADVSKKLEIISIDELLQNWQDSSFFNFGSSSPHHQ